jgi:hypothetical protein
MGDEFRTSAVGGEIQDERVTVVVSIAPAAYLP